MSSSMTVEHYTRDAIGEMMIVQERRTRLFRSDIVTQALYERRSRAHEWTRGLVKVSRAVNIVLNQLVENWEHDHADAGHLAVGYQPTSRGELFECDCGREHPGGHVCLASWRDQL